MTGEQREAIVGYVEKVCAAVKGGAVAEAGDGTGTRLAFYREHELGRTWYDVADPREFLSMKPIVVESVDPNADRHTAKAIFRKMPPVRNAADGRVVRFTVRAAKKLAYHREVNIFGLSSSFDRLFAESRRAWSETVAEIPNHRQHPNIDAYHHYIVKATVGGELFYVRFTVREDANARDGNEFHGMTVSCVCVYKSKDASVSDPSHAQEEALASLKATGTERSLRSRTHGENSVPFVDNKIALFLSAVNGVGCEGETPLIETPLIKKFGPREREKEQ